MRVKQTKGVPAPAAAEAAKTDAQQAPKSDPGVLTLSDGRMVGMEKPKGAVLMRLAEIAGPENSLNTPWMVMARAILHIKSLDGKPVIRPTTKIQVYALVDQLGDDSLEEVVNHFLEHFIATAESVRPLSQTPSGEAS